MPNASARALAFLALALAVAPATAALGQGEAEEPSEKLQVQPTDDETTAKVKEHFQKALVHIEFKRYKEATEQLQKIIALKPNSALIAELYHDTVRKLIDAGITSQDPKLKELAEKLQKKALEGRIAQLRTTDYIQKQVEQVRTGDFIERTRAMEELIAAGEYAVPYVVRMIYETKDSERQAYGSYILSQLRGTAVLPICESLKRDGILPRQLIIDALAIINDPRSIPWLLWVAQDPDTEPVVAASARQALAKIADDPAKRQQPAEEAFLGLARRYYAKDSRILLPHLYEHLVWRYDPKQEMVTSEAVPPYLFPYRMAEEAARNALLVNPEFEPAVPMHICALFAQQNELEAFFAVIEDKELSEEEKKEVALAEPLRERLRAAPLIAQAAGKKFVYAALQQALRDGKTDVALSCIDVLPPIADGSALPKPPPPPGAAQPRQKEPKPQPESQKGPVVSTWYRPEAKPPPEPPPPTVNPYALELDGSPLVDALSYPDRRVRYDSAEALVAIGPGHVIRDAHKVMSNLSDALSETAFHVALVVFEDEAAAEQLRPLLRDVGVVPVLARTQRDAMARAVEVPPKDLIILDSALQQVDVVELLASLRDTDKLAATPAILVADKRQVPQLRLKLKDQPVTFLTRPYNAETVKRTVEELIKDAPPVKGEAQAVRYASAAAHTLAGIDPATSTFRLQDALPALLSTVISRTQPDAVRIPTADAIRHLGEPKAVRYLADAYGDPDASKDLHLALIRALGACCRALPQLPDDAAAILARASYHSDIDYRRAAARAYGRRGGAGTDFLTVADQLQGKRPAEK
ncbi:MAG: hypothetical protein ACLF0G_09685 [Candidatus Brocadiia bacterium]